MRFRDIRQGHRAIKRVPLPLVNRPHPLIPEDPALRAQRESDIASAQAAGDPPPPSEVIVGLRVLRLDEETLIYEKASAFARQHGMEGALNDRDPVYNLGLSLYTCAIACVDPDSDVTDPAPFFGERGDIESAALELLSSNHIGRDGLAWLAEQQEHWQDQTNPRVNKMSPYDLYQQVEKMCSEEEDVAVATFLGMRPGMQLRSMIFMGSLLRTSPLLKSMLGQSSAETTSSGAGSEEADRAELAALKTESEATKKKLSRIKKRGRR